MRLLFFTCVLLLLTSATFPQAQTQGSAKPPPPEKRWERDSQKIIKAVKLTNGELAKMKIVFMSFYKEMDALQEKNNGERPSKQEADKCITRRNDAIKQLLTKEKYDRFARISKELGPPKPPPQ